MTRPILEGGNLNKRYGGVIAVNEVSIQVSPGEILGLVGPNGAGKTTLIDIITGAQQSDGGDLLLRGLPLNGPPSRRGRQGLARTFQYPQLAHDLTVREFILLGRVARHLGSAWAISVALVKGLFSISAREDEWAVERIADETRIAGLERRCGDLTLGEQRLVEVARALAQEPAVLILDEPFAGADASGIEGIGEAIRIVQRQGQGVILVDHNVDLVASHVDRIMLLEQGRSVFDGDPRDCLKSEEMQRVYFGNRSHARGQ
jgi:branched-chain amino acid transport system ATP-binding protein